jgi:hypothetical protein
MECSFLTSGPGLEGRGGDGFFWEAICFPTTTRGDRLYVVDSFQKKDFLGEVFFCVLSYSGMIWWRLSLFHEGVYGKLKFQCK